ncbi:hypothetical protein PROFUN_00875 [Planoprotostelium fungivorum]|uniref:Uncharacterized protein n=1 Tax=Planoprotostelium fungivorum TaxID=1890364 RepID=A0A2P6P070_9EUKA|nr:hypothetical protein PROFUN_00875 [Planoprotostelium fungivorum]
MSLISETNFYRRSRRSTLYEASSIYHTLWVPLTLSRASEEANTALYANAPLRPQICSFIRIPLSQKLAIICESPRRLYQRTPAFVYKFPNSPSLFGQSTRSGFPNVAIDRNSPADPTADTNFSELNGNTATG